MRIRFLTIGLAALAVVGASEAMAVAPYSKPDESWISIGGTVVEPTADSFVLDYGENVITVEVDDWDRYSETYGLLDGDRVMVYGKVDDDLCETATIEAGSIYIYGLNPYIYSSSADEEGDTTSFYPYYWTAVGIPVTNEVTIRGTVTGVDPDGREFKVNRGKREMTVETDEMIHNPLGRFGFQRMQSGDVVSVTGKIDYDFFSNRVLEADVVTTNLDASSKS
jgi:uncharacterized protein YdeI (BOF family)